MNAATYTAITAASDTSASHQLGPTATAIICIVCFGLIAGIIILCILDGK